MNFQTRAAMIVLASLLATGMAGCFAPGDGEVAVYVKDAPTDEFRHINLTFNQVDVHRSGDDNESGWTTLVDDEHTVDLLAYSGADARAFLGMANISAGTYQQIRIAVTQATGVESDGQQVDIVVSSQTARVVRAFNVSAGDTTRLILDLDLDRALVQQGNGAWRLTPVIGQVIVEEDAQGAEASVRGTGASGDAMMDGGSSMPGGGSPAGGTGIMTTYVKDQATDEFSEIWLAFDRVTVHRAGGDDPGGNNTSQGEGNASDDGSWVVVVDTPRSVNLLNFSEEGSKAFLGESELAASRYTQIRINVTQAWGIRDSDGQRVNFTVTTASAKVVRSFLVEENQTTQVVIDVDLDRSLHRQGPPGSDTWRLTPVIGRVLVEENVSADPMGDVPDSAQG